MPEETSWFAVRCLFRSPDEHVDGLGAYEERITLWRAPSWEVALARAEVEADEYADFGKDMGMLRVDMCQAYQLPTVGPLRNGDEVFSET